MNEQFSRDEFLQLESNLWPLFLRRGRLYAGGNSSVREETAVGLYSSLCFLMLLLMKTGRYAKKELLTLSPDDLLKNMLRAAEDKVTEGQRLFQAVRETLPASASDYLTETISGIGIFFNRYDLQFFAHEIPGMIDYFLASPVDESLLGIEYICEYLRRLYIENCVLGLFPLEKTDALLTAAYGNFRRLPLNLYEPVLKNALGLVLLGLDPLPLNFSRENNLLLRAFFSKAEEKEGRTALCKAAEAFCDAFFDGNKQVADYLKTTATALSPYLHIDEKPNTNGPFYSF